MSNYPPNNPNDPNRGQIDLGGVNAPDMRRRVRPNEARQDLPVQEEPPRREYSRRDPPRQDPPRRSSGGDDSNSGEEPSGCLNIGGFTLNWQMVIFIFVLIIAGLRGGRDTRGCLPSRQCLNGIFAIIGGTGLTIAGIYYGSLGGDETLALAVSCGGALVCMGGGGGMIFLLLGMMRAIDFTPETGLDGGGLFDGLFGGDRR